MPPRANPAEKSDDEKLLIAVLSIWDPLPPVDNNKLGEILGIKPGTAAVRWHRFKARLLKNNEDNIAGDNVGVEEATAAEVTTAHNSGVGQETAVIEKSKRGNKRGRKRAAVKEESDEPPTQRKKIDKTIAMAMNAATSKPGPGKGKTNKDKGHLGGLDELNGMDGIVKQENGDFENGLDFRFDGLFSGDEA